MLSITIEVEANWFRFHINCVPALIRTHTLDASVAQQFILIGIIDNKNTNFQTIINCLN